MSILITVISFIVILSVLVLIHEFGHFVTALWFGMTVEEFGVGFPPRVWSTKRKGIVYSINALPIGGFVKLYGEDEAGGGRVSKHSDHSTSSSVAHDPKAFVNWPAWKRFATIVAGVVMNFVLAVVLISYLFAIPGVVVPTGHIKVTDVAKNSPASQIGIQKGDIIVSVSNKSLSQSNDFISEVQKELGKPIPLQLSRNGSIINATVTPRKIIPKGQGPIGIGIEDSELKKYPIYSAPFYGTWEALKFSWIIIKGLGGIVVDLVSHGTPPKGVAGPVGVAELTGQAIQYGFDAVLWFVALLSLNLAVMNVLPIPALDGGRLFFILIELVTGRRVSQKYESYTHTVGMVVLLSLMVLITISDVLHLLSGKSILTP